MQDPKESINLNGIAAPGNIATLDAPARCAGDYEFRRRRGSHAGDAFLMLLDIIGSNASRQTTREISYRLVAALALLVTAYSWNASASIDSERYEPVAYAIYTLSSISRRASRMVPRKQLMSRLLRPAASYIK